MAQVWQYRLATFATGRDAGVVERELNSYGKAGWELVALTGAGVFGSQTSFVFKRPVTGEPDPSAEPGVAQAAGWM